MAMRKIEVIWVDNYGKQHHTFEKAHSESEAIHKVKQNKKTFRNLIATGYVN